MYMILAVVETVGKDGYTGSRSVPTFFLNEEFQGIISKAHAEKIARDILGHDGEITFVNANAHKV